MGLLFFISTALMLTQWAIVTGEPISSLQFFVYTFTLTAFGMVKSKL